MRRGGIFVPPQGQGVITLYFFPFAIVVPGIAGLIKALVLLHSK